VRRIRDGASPNHLFKEWLSPWPYLSAVTAQREAKKGGAACRRHRVRHLSSLHMAPREELSRGTLRSAPSPPLLAQSPTLLLLVVPFSPWLAGGRAGWLVCQHRLRLGAHVCFSATTQTSYISATPKIETTRPTCICMYIYTFIPTYVQCMCTQQGTEKIIRSNKRKNVSSAVGHLPHRPLPGNPDSPCTGAAPKSLGTGSGAL
jgi:hypothetical protein